MELVFSLLSLFAMLVILIGIVKLGFGIVTFIWDNAFVSVLLIIACFILIGYNI